MHELITNIQSDQKKQNNNKSEESLAFSIFCTTNATRTRQQSTTELNGQFLHSQLLIDCLIRMKSTSNDVNELISLCKEEYSGNKSELEIVHEFEKEYSPTRALWWYTRQSFLYRILNKALRMQDVDILYLFRFFIRDLERQIDQHRCTSCITVYRGQLVSNSELDTLKDSIGEFISMNSFLSTSIDRRTAVSFLYSSDIDDELQRVLFEIDADGRLDLIKPFANISSLSFFPEEQEILMMIGSVFRLINIQHTKDRLWVIQMRLCSDNDHDLKSIYDHMKETAGVGETTLISFGNVLCNMGKFDSAQKYLHRSLNEQSHDEKEIADCYYSLGIVAYEKGTYDNCLKWHQKALKIRQQTLTSPHYQLARSLNWIGLGFWKTNEYKQALESYENALIMFQQVFGKEHPDVAECYNNIAIIYSAQKKYSKALEFHRKSLSIREKCLPVDHSDLGETHNNLGVTYNHLRQYDLALRHYNESFRVKTKCLPPQHPAIAMTLMNMGLIYEKTDRLQQALSCFEQAATIYRHTFSSTHNSLNKCEQHIRHLSSKLKLNNSS